MKNVVRRTLNTYPCVGHLLLIKVALIAFMVAIGSLWSPSQAQVSRIDRLFARPDGTSQVVVTSPSFVQVWVEQVNDYDTCVWVLVDVNITWPFQWHNQGWVYIPKVRP